MTDDKTDAGPGRGDGEARGVSGGEPRPPGEGWWRMWGDDACLPDSGRVVQMWHCDWSGIRCIDEFPEGSSIKGIWWRPLKFTQGYGQAKPRDLPSWARRPMIDSGPSNPPGATLSRNPNIPEGARVVVGSTAARPKHRIVHAWHDYAEHLTVLGSDGRIFWRTHNPEEWHEIATYPPGLEP